jgi:hypothetical protein
MEHIILLIITAIITSAIGFLVNKFLNQCQQRLDLSKQINIPAPPVVELQQIVELNQQITDLNAKIVMLKTDFEALRLSIGLKGNRS